MTPTPTPVPTGTPFPGATATLHDVAESQAIAAYAGYSGALSLSPNGGNASITLTETTSLIPPVAVPSMPPDPTTGATPTVLAYITLDPSAAITLEAQPTFALSLPTAPPTTAILESAFYNSADASAGWAYSSGSAGVARLASRSPSRARRGPRIWPPATRTSARSWRSSRAAVPHARAADEPISRRRTAREIMKV